ncbi:dATP/dGTP diphosphohydrolase domain-containing protein [Stenotrophomonas maltophilia]|uniref:dATP/dGTP diphosphohydrolase domain-containing protein n=1 Tax=Stenotrophomonas maltophilia TaxID=40324 RepID=UPI003CFAABEA
MTVSLPDDAESRNGIPMADGLLYYFPNALAEVAKVSRIGNEQHNPGQPMHWDRGKSTDHENKILRHLVDAGRRDGQGVRHSAYLAWRALALLQEEIEREEGAPLPRNVRCPKYQLNLPRTDTGD